MNSRFPDACGIGADGVLRGAGPAFMLRRLPNIYFLRDRNGGSGSRLSASVLPKEKSLTFVEIDVKYSQPPRR
jgi:hypothetical protein